MAQVAERVSFSSSAGPTLQGVVDLPLGEVRGWGVFAHGFTLGKDCPAASRICKQLASEGIGMLRFDNLGLGGSEGDWGDGSFSHKVADTVRAVEFMNGTGREVRLLVGHSFGGAAAIAGAHECKTVAAVASIGAPYEPAHVERNYDALIQRIEADGYAAELTRFGIETTIVVPGSFTTGTNHFANAGHAADDDIAAAYDEHYAGLMDQVSQKLAELAPEDADPAEVAHQIVQVVDTPGGSRPFRVYIDPADDGAEEVFRVGDRIRETFYQRVGLTDLLSVSNPVSPKPIG